ncbi:hypothetical protein EON65_51360 [archaeon]|nr:MAG: hypothetical protein EON65_51360 [archaeon]
MPPYCLAAVRNFNRFAPMAQAQGLPLVALLEKDSRLVTDGEDSKPLSGTHLSSAKRDVLSMSRPIMRVGIAIMRILGVHGEISVHTFL